VKLGDLRHGRRAPAFRGRVVVDTCRGVVRVRKWPRSRKTLNRQSAAITATNDWFKAAAKLVKWVDPDSQLLAKTLAEGTANYPRDILTLALAGNLVSRIDLAEDGYSLARMTPSPVAYPFIPEPSNQPAVDPDFSSVRLLIGPSGDGPDDPATDISVPPHTLTANGVAGIDLQEPLYYPSSVYFGGNKGYLSAADSADWQIAAGQPFSVEFFVMHDSTLGGGNGAGYIGHWSDASSNRGWIIYRESSNNTLAFTLSTNGLYPGAAGSLWQTWTPTLKTWYHIEVTRDASNVARMFINGDLKQSKSIPGASFNSTTTFKVGAANVQFTYHYSLEGWMTGVRWTKGVCRHTASFTPPNAPFGLG